MTMNPRPQPMNDEKLDELLIEWDLQRQEGREPTVDELCSSAPELRDRLLSRIHRLKTTDWLFDFSAGEELPTSLPSAAEIEVDQLLKAARHLPIHELRARLLSSDLLPLAHRESIEQEFTDTINSASLLETLVGRNVLTPFQARTLCDSDSVPLVLGDYVLLDLLGAGGMGQVYRARHRQLDRVVALKILPRSLVADPMFRQRFEREIRAISTLAHPNIVAAFDAREERGVCFLSMECVDGEDLHARVRRDGPLDLDTALNFITQAAEALEFAHANGIVHRDVKPSNLLLTNEGTIKVADFGLAQIEQSNDSGSTSIDVSLTATGLVLGSLDFLAPEQAHSARDADQRSDIYSLGCTLYYLVTGRVPFEGENPVQKLVAHREQAFPSVLAANLGWPDELDDVLSCMTAKEPSERYQTVADCLTALRSIGQQPSRADARRQDSNRHTGIAKALAAVVAISLGALIYFNTGNGRVEIEVHRDDVTVEVNGVRQQFEIISPRDRIAVAVDAGSNKLKVTTKDGLEFYTASFRIFRHGTTELTAKFQPIPGTVRDGPPQVEQSTIPSKHSAELLTEVAVASNWSRPEKESVVAGILPMPASFAGFDWNIETVAPRVQATSVSWSPDGKSIAVGDQVGVIRVFDAADLSLKSFWTTDERGRNSIFKLSWTPDSQALASVTRPGRGNPICRIWTIDGEQQHALKHDGRLTSVAWSSNGQRLVCGTEDGKCVVWSVEGKRLDQIDLQTGSPVHVEWGRDEFHFHVLLEDRSVRLCNAEDGSTREVVNASASGSGTTYWLHHWPCFAIQNDGYGVAIGATNSTSVRIMTNDKEDSDQLPHEFGVSSIAWSFDGKYVATGVRGAAEIVVWSRDGTRRWSQKLATGEQVYVDWCPTDDRVVAVDANGSISVFDATGEVKFKREGHFRGERSYVSFSPNHEFIATNGSKTDGVRIWNPTGAIVTGVSDGQTWESGDGIAWSPSSDQLLAGARLLTTDGRVIRKWPFYELQWADWNANTNRIVALVRRHGEPTVAMITTPDAERLHTLAGHTGFRHAEFSRDGSQIATASADHIVRVWDASGKLLSTMSRHDRGVNCVTWNPDATQLASGDEGGLVVISNSDGDVITTEFLNRGQIRSMDWSDDGKWLALGMQGAAVILWEVAGTRRLEIDGLRTYCDGVSWGHNNQLATFGVDNRLIVWDAATGNAAWTGVTLYGNRAATIRANGTLIHHSDTAAQSDLVYRVDHHDGRTEILTLPEFRKLTSADN